MTGLWERVRGLQGRDLPTTTGRARFAVVRVTDAGVIVRPRSTMNEHHIPRDKIEKAYALGRSGVHITPEVLRRHKITEFHAAYIAGLMQAIEDPGV
jgi:hypothetical protein